MRKLEGARVFVTGAAGFIGSHLTRQLVREKAKVGILSKSVSKVIPVRLSDIYKTITIFEGDLSDGGAIKDIIDSFRPEIIFHLGAYTHVGRSFTHLEECIQSNIQGTVNLLQSLQGIDFDRFIYTGTSEIYGDIAVPFKEDGLVNPISPYSISKYTGELYCRMFHQAYNWPIVMLRPFNAYGPMQSPDRIIPEVIVSALTGHDIEMTEGAQTREFNYVEDLADGFIKAATASEAVLGQVINLGCGQDYAMRDIAQLIIKMMGSPIKAKLGVLPYRPKEIWKMYCDNTKAKDLLGWQPQHTLEQGLRKTVDWYTQEFKNNQKSLFLL